MGLLDRKNEDVTITRKMPNGASVTYKSPQDSQMDLNGILGGMVDGYSPTPVADNHQISVTGGEYVLNKPATDMMNRAAPGLLDSINQQGRVALAQGGWIDKPKPMGYANGGAVDPFSGYANYGKEQFLNEASTFNNPGAQPMALAPQPVQQQEVVQEPVVEQPVVETNVTPNVNTVIGDGVPSKDEVNAITAEETKVAAESVGADEELATEISEVTGKATGVESYLANLDSQIDKQTDKRKKARLLAFGLSLLGGDSMSTALQVANRTPFFDSEQLDQLLDQRNDLMNGIHNDYLVSQGLAPIKTSSDGGSSGSGDDGSVVLTATLQKEVRDLINESERNNISVSKIDGLISDIETHGGWAGLPGQGVELFKRLAGGQDEISSWKTNFTALVNSEVVNNLPPGVASDRDIELVKSGYPDASWNTETVNRWLRTYQKVVSYIADRDAFRAGYIERTGKQTGWKTEFEEQYGSKTPSGSVGDQGDTPPASETNFDYDFTQ